MIKLFIYIPLHIFNMWIAYLSPRWVFKIAYAPSSEAVRDQETMVRNKARLLEYKLKGDV